VARDPIPSWYFALVVVRRGHRFLAVQERKYGSAWAIPGGRVEPGESFVDAALREVQEEAGVPVRLDGILRVEHSPSETGARVRVIFAGSPLDDTPPKAQADDESLGAAFLTLDELRARNLRGAEVLPLLEAVISGQQVFPLELLGRELHV
jgi:phosphatase NudJ